MSTKTTFSSKIGLIAATVGSAVGLGNVWRFPSEAQGNGGAAFLVVYIGCVFLLGVPVMLAEFSLGRAGGSDAVGSFKNLTPHKKWWIIGIVALIASYLILSFYMVVTGWTLEYMWHSITGSLYDGITGAAGSPAVNQQFTEKMHQMTSTAISPLIWTYIALIANLVILLRGVQKGIEKMANILMPALFVVLIIFCCMSLTLPHAGEGVLFFLDPDFSKINATVVIDALGQAFFSLSLGMGILVTYASYYPKDTMLTRTAVTVSSLDFLVSFMMGLIIFPAIKSFGLDGDSAAFQGTTLIFVTLPEVFHSIGATQFWSILFFFLLFVAALTSTISIAEVSIAFIHERLNLSRTKACLYVIIPVFFTSAVCSLSLGSLMWLKVGSMSVFDFLDTLTTDLLLPVSAIFICVYVGWILPKDFIKKELTNYGKFSSWMAPFVQFLIKYICPVLIALVLISKLIDTISK